jgi:DNA-binding response OmpR family regulator
MLVDDDESLRALLRATLPVDTFTIVEARDGQEALERLHEEEPDLLVLDWKMPERSGEEVLGIAKSVYPNLPVIVLTAEQQPRERQVAESLGADEFLTKPFSPLELLATVDRFLGAGLRDL